MERKQINNNYQNGKSLEDQTSERDFSLWRLLDHTWFMIYRLREHELFRFGLTPEQAGILYILSHNRGSSTILEISKITQRQHHSVSTQLSRLANMRLVKKDRTAQDKRRYEVVITVRGKSVFGRITRDSIKDIFAALSTKDKSDLSLRLECLLRKAYRLQRKRFSRPDVNNHIIKSRIV